MRYGEDVFLAILNMSITASYTAIAVIMARLLLKKAPKIFSYTLWGIVIFRLICPVSFSFVFSLLGLLSPTTQYIPPNLGLMAAPAVDTGISSLNAAVNSLLPAATPLASINPLQVWLALGTLIWLLGLAVMLSHAVFSYLRLKSQVSTATLVADNIYETDLIHTPFVCGLSKPKIYLPLSLSGPERGYIVTHEQVHIKRLDYLVKPLAFLALALHWFNPLMWLCFSLLSKDMEMSCDERVIQSTQGEAKVNYSNSLLNLTTAKKMPSPSPLAFGESNIKARIRNVLHYKKPTLGLLIACTLVIIILAVTLLSNPGPKLTIQDRTSPYDVEALLKNKTPYIGNNSKVMALVNALPLPEGVTRETIALSTSHPPYGLTIYYSLKDDSQVSREEQFLRNSVLLFALIDNAQGVTHQGYWQNKLLSSTPFKFSYTRADAEKIVGGDLRQFAENKERLSELIQIIQRIGPHKAKN